MAINQEHLDLLVEKQYEIIEGSVYLMSPAPSVKHQKISWEISRQLSSYLKGKECKAFAAPCDVKLKAEDKSKDSTVQPDIFVVCDTDKIKDDCIEGIPDFIIEISSKSTSKRDSTIKKELYFKFGVKEYWLVESEAAIVRTFVMNEDKTYINQVYDLRDTISVSIFDNLDINVQSIFDVSDEEMKKIFGDDYK